jgi:hypothetical protein
MHFIRGVRKSFDLFENSAHASQSNNGRLRQPTATPPRSYGTPQCVLNKHPLVYSTIQLNSIPLEQVPSSYQIPLSKVFCDAYALVCFASAQALRGGVTRGHHRALCSTCCSRCKMHAVKLFQLAMLVGFLRMQHAETI